MTCRCQSYNTVIATDSPRAYVVGDAMPPTGTSLYVSPGGTPDYTLATSGTAPSGNGALAMGPALSDADAPVTFLLGDALGGSPLYIFGPWSLECWLKPDGINLNYIPFGSTSYPVTLFNDALQLGPQSLAWSHPVDGTSWLQIGGALINGPGEDPGSTPIGTWHHIVFTNDQTQTPKYKLYVDCRLVATNTSPAAPVGWEDPIDRLIIGCRLLNPEGDGLLRGWQPFSGRVADVALYDYALSACQVMCHYEAGSGLRCCGRPARAQIQSAG